MLGLRRFFRQMHLFFMMLRPFQFFLFFPIQKHGLNYLSNLILQSKLYIMAYYQLRKQSKVINISNHSEIIFMSLFQPKEEPKKYLLTLDVSGILTIFHISSDKNISSSEDEMCYMRVDEQGKRVQTIIKAELMQECLIIFTHKNIYSLNISKIHQMFEANKEVKHQEGFKKLSYDGSQIYYQRLIDKKVKIIMKDQQYILKICGRIREQIVYYYCEINIKKSTLRLINHYTRPFQHIFKVSLSTSNENFIIYENYVKTYDPIRIHLIDFVKNYSSQEKGDACLQKEMKIVQFQESCLILQVYKVNFDVICLLCSSNCQDVSLSFIIVYDIRNGSTLNHVILKDILITESQIYGVSMNKDYTYGDDQLSIDCIALQNDKHVIVQVFPYCHHHYDYTPIQQATLVHYDLTQLLLYDQQHQQVIIQSKIPKNLLYVHMIETAFAEINSLQACILQLLN